MEGEINKFVEISAIYSRFTEKNKENLIKTAMNLLKVQQEDAVMLANACTPHNESERQCLA